MSYVEGSGKSSFRYIQRKASAEHRKTISTPYFRPGRALESRTHHIFRESIRTHRTTRITHFSWRTTDHFSRRGAMNVITVREIPSKVARSMTFKIYFQRWPSSLMRQTCWWWVATNSIPAARSAVFRARQRRNRCLARWKGVGETGCWNELSRGRHFPTSFGRNGHAWVGQTHLATLLTVPHGFHENVRSIFFSWGNHPRDVVHIDILQEPSLCRCRGVSAMLNRDFPPRMPSDSLRSWRSWSWSKTSSRTSLGAP